MTTRSSGDARMYARTFYMDARVCSARLLVSPAHHRDRTRKGGTAETV